MGKFNPENGVTLTDLGFNQDSVLELADRPYVPVRAGEAYPGSVTQEINGEPHVLSVIARAARSRFEGTGVPAKVGEVKQ